LAGAPEWQLPVKVYSMLDVGCMESLRHQRRDLHHILCV